MASRLTTNQEIAGSTPAVVINELYFWNSFFVRDFPASNWRPSHI
jgi:hypothetical protein